MFKIGDLVRIKEDHAKTWDIPLDSLVNCLIIDRQYGWALPHWPDELRVDNETEYFKLLTADDGTCFETIDMVIENYELVK